MSPNERKYLIVAVVALLIWGGDSVVYRPLAQRMKELDDQRVELQDNLRLARNASNERKAKSARGRAMLASGLQANPSAAESQILRKIGEWADSSRLNRVSIQPETSRERGELKQINITASFTGRMDSVTNFMYLIESSQVPVKVKQVIIEAKREGTDEVSLSLRLSTLYGELGGLGGPSRG
ncbi:MAG: GspMb/PilO family protein [Planctomycetota bacterium]|jgi:hypothetical protein